MALRQSKSKVVHSELLLSVLLREFENEKIGELLNREKVMKREKERNIGD